MEKHKCCHCGRVAELKLTDLLSTEDSLDEPVYFCLDCLPEIVRTFEIAKAIVKLENTTPKAQA